MLLTKRGFSVMMAEDGLQAVVTVERFGTHFFDLIFLDNTMPNMVSQG
jgi:CheY-like chemotaxis protein